MRLAPLITRMATNRPVITQRTTLHIALVRPVGIVLHLRQPPAQSRTAPQMGIERIETIRPILRNLTSPSTGPMIRRMYVSLVARVETPRSVTSR